MIILSYTTIEISTHAYTYILCKCMQVLKQCHDRNHHFFSSMFYITLVEMTNQFLEWTGCYDCMIKDTCTIINYHVQCLILQAQRRFGNIK